MKEFPDWWESELKNVGKGYSARGLPYILTGLMDDGDGYYYVMHNTIDNTVEYVPCSLHPTAYGFKEEV